MWILLSHGTIRRHFDSIFLIYLSQKAVARIILVAFFGATPDTVLAFYSPILNDRRMISCTLNVVSPAAPVLVLIVCAFGSHENGNTFSQIKLELAPVMGIAATIVNVSLSGEIVNILSWHLAINSLGFSNSSILALRECFIAMHILSTYCLHQGFLAQYHWCKNTIFVEYVSH